MIASPIQHFPHNSFGGVLVYYLNNMVTCISDSQQTSEITWVTLKYIAVIKLSKFN